MRTPEEMFRLIEAIAREDDRIRAASVSGSRANRECPADAYQDYDITVYVREVGPFWDNDAWIAEKFGAPCLMQKPESMGLIPPDNDGRYAYLMIFPDGNRVDLCFAPAEQAGSGEPEVVLLDKDGILAGAAAEPEHWHVKRPTAKQFADCCNEFHWCLNNVAKGIARDEVPYVMHMVEDAVRPMLITMLGWYVGTEREFAVSIGKRGKYLKKLLPETLYRRFLGTYAGAETQAMWGAAFAMLDLFGDVARTVAERLDFAYNVAEEAAIEDYMRRVKDGEFEENYR